MKCEQVEEQLIALVYGDLPEDERAAAEEHLASCEHCSHEAALLRKAHMLLDEAASDEQSHKAVPLSLISQRAIQQIERGRRRWRAFGLASAAVAIVLVVSQLFSLRIEFGEGHVEIAWGEQTSSPVPVNARDVMPTDDIPPIVSEHQSRLDDLDRLVHFLIRVQGADGRGRERELVAMTQRLDSIQKQHATWQRTLDYFIRTARIDDLAQQLSTPTRLEGDME